LYKSCGDPYIDVLLVAGKKVQLTTNGAGSMLNCSFRARLPGRSIMVSLFSW
jgi:hypothetical protein